MTLLPFLFKLFCMALPASRICDPSVNAAQTCKKLQDALPGKVSFATQPPYDASVGSYFFQTARQTPDCIVNPTSADDVSKAIKIIAENPRVKFAIRSGGHSPHPEVANTETGVTIDLQTLNGIAKAPNSEDVYRLGGGLHWDAVYEYLDGVNRTAVGARASGVGVGGFTSGGGLAFFSPELGFGCDNVVNFEVVLSSGEIVNANAKSNSDLYRALKGGQNNFGVITRFDVKTLLDPGMWGGGVQHPLEPTEDQVLDAFVALKTQPYDPYAGIELSFLYVQAMNTFICSNNMAYLRPTVDAPSLKRFTDIQPQIRNTMRIAKTKELARDLQAVQPKDTYAMYFTTSFFISPTILKKISTIWKAASQEMGNIPGLLSVLTFQQFPPQFESSANAMGFKPDAKLHEKLVVLIVSIYWPDPDGYEKVIEISKKTLAKIETETKNENIYHPYQYVNYAGFWQEPIKSYGPDAVRTLEQVSRKYDPCGLFQKQAVGFKLRG